MKRILLIILLLCPSYPMLSQGLFTLTSDKPEYSYGEEIVVSVSVFNNTDSTIVLYPECEYPIWIRVKGVRFIELHSLADGCSRSFAKGEKETWTFRLDPSKLGFPIEDGEQIIYAQGYNHIDSIIINAPKYYGGIIEVKYNYMTEQSNRDNFFNNLNAEVIEKDTVSDLVQIDELWSVYNASIDSLVYEQNKSPNRFGRIGPYRLFTQGFKTVTSIRQEVSGYRGFIHAQNYPNPFNPSTSIIYELPASAYVSITIFDVLGRIVSSPFRGFKYAGRNITEFNGSKLAGGVYFCVITANNLTKILKLILQK